MPFAFVSTRATGRRTGFDHYADDRKVRGGLPRQNTTGGGAEVAAVETKADTAHQLPNVRLGETRIGATRAGSPAARALVDAVYEGLAIKARRLRMRLDHIANCHVDSLSSDVGPDDPARAPCWSSSDGTPLCASAATAKARVKSASAPVRDSMNSANSVGGTVPRPARLDSRRSIEGGDT